jgi:Helix-turn-helix
MLATAVQAAAPTNPAVGERTDVIVRGVRWVAMGRNVNTACEYLQALLSGGRLGAMVNPATELRKKLDEQGLNQQAAAELLGLSVPMVSMLLNGKRQPGPETLKWLGLRKVTKIRYERVNGS